MTVQVLTSPERPAQSVTAPQAVAAHRTWNRFELKYLVPHRKVQLLRESFAGYVRDDPNGGADGYRVYSVYWDSPRHRFFWEKIDGEKVRRKLRFRTYGERRDVFVEIKGRIDRTVQKRRVILPLEQVERAFRAGAEEPWSNNGELHPIMSEVYCLVHEYNLRPTMAVSYRRQALFGIYEPDLRITFDSRVQYSSSELDIGQPFDTGHYMLDPRVSIMEVKFNHRLPLWLIRTISRLDLAAIRFSKYCSAVDRAYYGNQYT